MHLVIGSTPVHAIGNGYFGDVELIHRWPGGPFEASFGMALPPGFRHTDLQRGKRLLVMDGMSRIWGGTIADIDRASWSFKADGWCRQAERTPALDGTGSTTSVPDVAVDAAIARGELVGWQRTASVGAVPVTASAATDGINTLDTLLATAAGYTAGAVQWMVDADGMVMQAAVPTTPTLFLAPGVLDLGVMDDEYATHVYLRYRDSTASGAYKTAAAFDDAAAEAFGPKSITESGAVDLGPITPARAAALAAAVLARMRPRLGWTESIEIDGSQLMDVTGKPADLLTVTSGQLMRIFGTYDEFTGAGVADALVGESRYRAGSSAITLAPVNRTALSQEEVWEAVMTKASAKRFRA